MFLEKMAKDKNIVPCFNSFYEFMRDDYRAEMAQRPIPIYKQDFDIDNFLTTLRQYYQGGRFDFLLNSKENIDLLGKRFIVFEIDSIKDNKELFPVVTIIIMEAFINKMRRLKGIRKVLICEEAWKALSSANMAEYMKYLYKTVRKYFGEAVVVTQEVDDIISSPIVKETIINNSDCEILLDQRKYMNRFDQIQELLGLTDKEKSQILSINMANNPNRLYKEVWIGLGSTRASGICHGGFDRRISLLHHRGNGEDSGTQQGKAIRWRHRSRHQDARQREKGGCNMKIPKAFHPIIGVLTGFILFLAGIAILTIVFVGVVKAANYAAPSSLLEVAPRLPFANP